jgi:hypothetical protein
MSGTNESLAIRLNNLNSQLENDPIRFLGSILDMENAAAKLTQPEVTPLTWHKTIAFEEFSDEEGRLNDQNIEEGVWLESLKRETGLDCRMILDFKPVKELGMERWQVLASRSGKSVMYDLQVWIVPVGKDSE